MDTGATKRVRATVVAEQNGKVLLVKEIGASRYTLPGGGIEEHESTMEAACRELREETGLTSVKAEYLFDHEGRVLFHRVVSVKAESHVRLQHTELTGYTWWDENKDVPMGTSTKAILDQVNSPKHNIGATILHTSQDS